jgi:hypothetical protein
MAADLEAARRAGLLKATPEEAWGNAAIPGFGIGRPVESPDLDPGTTEPILADGDQAARAEQLFEVPDHELVIGRGPHTDLAIYLGEPTEAREHHDRGFVLGLGGAMLATASALAFAVMVTGRI